MASFTLERIMLGCKGGGTHKRVGGRNFVTSMAVWGGIRGEGPKIEKKLLNK